MKKIAWSAALLVALTASASAQTLRFGFNEDVDTLDPTLSRGYTTRIIFSALCDKLVDITPDLKLVPQLATEWSWSSDAKTLTMKLRPNVLFQDGEPLNAEAVKYSLDRHRELAGSQRKAELAPVTAVDVVDDLTVRITTATPFPPLVSYLADRAGMIVSPKAAKALGDKFTTAPVCAGPFKFVERVAQDRVVVEKFDKYWNADHIKFGRIEFKTLPDPAVRLANLRSGQLDLIERIAPTDAKGVRADARLQVFAKEEIGWNGIIINIGGDKAKNPLGADPRVREAFELAIDRGGVAQVLSAGEFVPGNQWVAPTNAAYDKAIPVPKRDVARAKALLAEAGQPKPSVTLTTPNFTEAVQFAQIIQAMAREAGFDVKIQTLEFATMLDAAQKGDFESIVYFWSGRVDPDGNIYNFAICGSPLNIEKYCNPAVDTALKASRQSTDDAARRKDWDAAADVLLKKDRPIVFVFHRKYLWGATNKLKGFVPYPDGLVRFTDLSLQ